MRNKFIGFGLGVYLFCFDPEFFAHSIIPKHIVSNNLRRKVK